MRKRKTRTKKAWRQTRRDSERRMCPCPETRPASYGPEDEFWHKTKRDPGGKRKVGAKKKKLSGGKKRCPVATKAQSIAFSKKNWTRKKAVAWVKGHGKKHSKVDETASEYRFRQLSPKAVTVVGSMPLRKGKGWLKGARMIIGCPARPSKKSKAKTRRDPLKFGRHGVHQGLTLIATGRWNRGRRWSMSEGPRGVIIHEHLPNGSRSVWGTYNLSTFGGDAREMMRVAKSDARYEQHTHSAMKAFRRLKEGRDPDHEYGHELAPGVRVELHPGLDRWMMGDRFGKIVSRGKGGVWRVKMDRSGKTLRVAADRLKKI